MTRGLRTAEQIVLKAFRGRTYITIGEVIALVEEVMATARDGSRGAGSRGQAMHGRPSSHRRKPR